MSQKLYRLFFVCADRALSLQDLVSPVTIGRACGRYVNSYYTALACVKRLRQSNSRFAAFVSAREADNPMKNGYTLLDFLILPIQRPMRCGRRGAPGGVTDSPSWHCQAALAVLALARPLCV